VGERGSGVDLQDMLTVQYMRDRGYPCGAVLTGSQASSGVVGVSVRVDTFPCDHSGLASPRPQALLIVNLTMYSPSYLALPYDSLPYWNQLLIRRQYLLAAYI
jgi:hypothetical protein